MIGLYPLGTYPTTFDFAVWAVIAKSNGVNHVRFIIEGKIDDAKYSGALAWRRFGNIVVPICGLAGLTFSVGNRIHGREFPYLYGDLNKTYEKCGTISKLKNLPTRGEPYITITLRESFRNKFRNSNMEAWNRVVKELAAKGEKVVVLEDCEEEPLSIERRMTLYSNAKMNLGVENGPMVLCHLSDAPYITINMCPERPKSEPGYDMLKLLESSGFMKGDQLKFRNEKQALVWKPDTFENIMEAYGLIA